MKPKTMTPAPTPKPDAMPGLSEAENARFDADAEREFEAGMGIPAEDLRSWLHDRIDGGKAPPPKAKKLS